MNVQFLRDALYRMKVDYGVRGKIYKVLTEIVDSVTGLRVVKAQVTNIKKVILSANSVVRKFFFDLAYMKANNAFTYGGDMPVTSIIVFVDFKDIKCDRLEIENNFLINRIRYTIKKVENVADVFYIVELQRPEGVLNYNIEDIQACSDLELYGEGT